MIWEITYRQSSILLCHIAFTYAVIYYVLPRYISSPKKWMSTTGILLLAFLGFFMLHYFFVYLASIDNNNSRIKQGVMLSAADKINSSVILTRMVGTIAFNVATVVGIAVSTKLVKRWWLKQKEAAQAAREKTNAELQLLKAQIHPHFLFNSLNNIYSFTLEGSPKAPEMIQKLSGLLHYMLYECKHPLVPLEKELSMIRDYIALEKIRYGDRLRVDIQIRQDNDDQIITPLLLIPFVENSFKHGTSKMLAHPYVILNITIQESILYFKLTNSRPSETEEISVNGNRGLGLKNVKKRLDILYPGSHELQIIDEPASYNVWLKIALTKTPGDKIRDLFQKEIAVYDLA